MNQKFTISLKFLILTSLVILCSCKKTNVDQTQPEIELSDQVVYTRSSGETATIVINASHAWTAESDQEWCKVLTAEGAKGTSTVEINSSAQPDQGYDDRESIITFKIGSYTQELKVVQRQKNALILSDKVFELSNKSQIITVVLQSTHDCMYRINTKWVRYVAPDKAGSKALNEANLRFEVSGNLEVDPRSTIIEILTMGLTPTLIDTIRLTQHGSELFTKDEFLTQQVPGYYVSKDSMILYDESQDQMIWNTQKRMFRFNDNAQSKLFLATMGDEPAIDASFSLDVATISNADRDMVEEKYSVQVLDVENDYIKLWNDRNKRGFIVRYEQYSFE